MLVYGRASTKRGRVQWTLCLLYNPSQSLPFIPEAKREGKHKSKWRVHPDNTFPFIFPSSYCTSWHNEFLRVRLSPEDLCAENLVGSVMGNKISEGAKKAWLSIGKKYRCDTVTTVFSQSSTGSSWAAMILQSCLNWGKRPHHTALHPLKRSTVYYNLIMGVKSIIVTFLQIWAKNFGGYFIILPTTTAMTGW